MSITAHPFVMFQGDAAAALDLYVAAIPGARVEGLAHHGPEAGPAEGQIAAALLIVGGLAIRCFDSPVKHAFGFTPAVSFFLDCTSEEELRATAAALGDGGQVLMAIGDYGFSRCFTWINDRFGVSWQINLP
jgi:predicted 3-demethylubiquinone-9 3-methyltransferase (glyoxalase superfamily)